MDERTYNEKRINPIVKLITSLRFQVTLATVLTVFILSFGIGLIITRHEKNSLTREVELRVLAQTRGMAASTERYMVLPDPELNMLKLIRETMSRDSDIISVVITDADDIIMAHPEVIKVNRPREHAAGTDAVSGLDFLQPGESIEEGVDFFIVSVPITRQYEGNIQYLGRVYTEFSKRKIDEVINKARGQVYVISGMVAAFGLIIALVMTNLITRPIYKLADGARRIGEGDLDVEIKVGGHNEIAQLADILNDTTRKLSEATKTRVAKERLDRELEIALEIQTMLLPSSFPEMQQLDIAGVCESATEVGGDYYDVFELGPKRLGLIIADVSGKGVPGLLVMGVARSVLRSQAREAYSAQEVLIRSNTIITPDVRTGMFITAMYGILDLEDLTFTVANAGHNPMIKITHPSSKGKQLETYKTQGRPLGFMAGRFFDERIIEQTIQLAEGDTIFLYTDGVIEAMNAEMDEFGLDRLNGVLSSLRGSNAREMVDGVMAEVSDFTGTAPQSDDLTILAVHINRSDDNKSAPEKFFD
ncbi:MAG: SpoIIE family protein phosphatase [bacterium]|nr:SpoIIE family protein phosphatase [bacterium]